MGETGDTPVRPWVTSPAPGVPVGQPQGTRRRSVDISGVVEAASRQHRRPLTTASSAAPRDQAPVVCPCGQRASSSATIVVVYTAACSGRNTNAPLGYKTFPDHF